MACKPKPLTEEQKTILKVLKESAEPMGTKDLAFATNLDSKVVSSKLKSLKTKGYIESPVRCKYSITKEGNENIN